ncbi:MAG: cytochrome D ubiquinol oxidase subunit I [Alphaproteobacteria bacterium]|nr:cytochrome D ubiquinol oxidase subunit I [Alphaproteobacteria bacterium]
MVKNTSLDPDDWEAFRAELHATLDLAVDHIKSRGDKPVWRPVPDPVRARFDQPLPRSGQELSQVVDRIADDILPYDVGNTHARFFGWVHGAGTPSAMAPAIMAAAMNANLGGRDHVAIEVEKQVIRWCRQMFDFPATAGGLVVSGTSMATLIALKAACVRHGGADLREQGLRNSKRQLVGYASSQAHSCIARSFDILGLGKNALRSIGTDRNFRMDTDELRARIARDLREGFQPFLIVGSAGTVNVGAIDPFDELADMAEELGLWLHVDGAFGALTVLNDALKPALHGIERANSLAFDFHKWMHVDYDAGFVLMREAEDQRRAFSERPDYLAGASRGLAAGNPWFCEYGPELSRGFRALKVWFHMSHFGLRAIGENIAENCALASALGQMVEAEPDLCLMAPVTLNIVCFRFDTDGLSATEMDRLNGDIVIELQERGLAVPSTTRINERLAIRVNITNHRTRLSDLEFLVQNVVAIGRDLRDI